MYDTFKNKLEEKLNEWFPKGKSKERGAALMLFAFAVELYETLRGKDINVPSKQEACPCHCHNDADGRLLAGQGIQCRCIKNCPHCHPENFIHKTKVENDMDVANKPEDCYCHCHCISWDCHTEDRAHCLHCANENTPDAEEIRRSFGDPDDDISEDDTEPWRYIREMIINFFLDIDDELPDDLLQANASLLVSRIKSGFIAKRDLLRLLKKKEIEYGKRQIIDDLFKAVKMAHD